MEIKKGTVGGRRGVKAICLAAALAMSLSLFYGCSKGEKEGPKDQTSQAAPGADQAKAHFDMGVQYSLRGEFDAAIKEYEETVRLNPGSVEAHNNMGFAYLDKGDVDRAIELQKKTLEMDPKFANAYYGLAQAFEKKGDKEKALKNWKEFKKMSDPHSRWWAKADERIQALEKGPHKK